MSAVERTQLATLIHKMHEENRQENLEASEAAEARANRIIEGQLNTEQHLEHIVLLMQELLRVNGREPPTPPARKSHPKPGDPGFKERRRKPS